jgi:hypothetical protein
MDFWRELVEAFKLFCSDVKSGLPSSSLCTYLLDMDGNMEVSSKRLKHASETENLDKKMLNVAHDVPVSTSTPGWRGVNMATVRFIRVTLSRMCGVSAELGT